MYSRCWHGYARAFAGLVGRASPFAPHGPRAGASATATWRTAWAPAAQTTLVRDRVLHTQHVLVTQPNTPHCAPAGLPACPSQQPANSRKAQGSSSAHKLHLPPAPATRSRRNRISAVQHESSLSAGGAPPSASPREGVMQGLAWPSRRSVDSGLSGAVLPTQHCRPHRTDRTGQ